MKRIIYLASESINFENCSAHNDLDTIYGNHPGKTIYIARVAVEVPGTEQEVEATTLLQSEYKVKAEDGGFVKSEV